LPCGLDADMGFDTRRRRRYTVLSVLVCLAAVRDAEQRSLDKYPDSLQETDQFEAGEHAVDALDEIIDLLADVY